MVLNIPTSDGLHEYVNYDYLNKINQAGHSMDLSSV